MTPTNVHPFNLPASELHRRARANNEWETDGTPSLPLALEPRNSQELQNLLVAAYAPSASFVAKQRLSKARKAFGKARLRYNALETEACLTRLRLAEAQSRQLYELEIDYLNTVAQQAAQELAAFLQTFIRANQALKDAIAQVQKVTGEDVPWLVPSVKANVEADEARHDDFISSVEDLTAEYRNRARGRQ